MTEKHSEVEFSKKKGNKIRNILLGGLAGAAIIVGAKANFNSESTNSTNPDIERPRVTRENFMQHLSKNKDFVFVEKVYDGIEGDHLVEVRGLKPRGINLVKIDLKTGEKTEIDNPNRLVEEVLPETPEQAEAVALAVDPDFIGSFDGKEMEVTVDGGKKTVDLWTVSRAGVGKIPVKHVEVVIDNSQRTLVKVIDDKTVGYVDRTSVID